MAISSKPKRCTTKKPGTKTVSRTAPYVQDAEQPKFTSVFYKNLNASEKIIVNVGGARSSKSYSLAQLLVEKLKTEKHKIIGIARKTMPALKMTAYRLFIDMLKDQGLYSRKDHSKRDYHCTVNGNLVQFFSIDEPEKLKSTEFNYIWMEEANEFSYDDFVILLTRLSGKTSAEARNHLYLTLNPSDANGWIPKILLKQKDVVLIKSTYRDNPFLSKDYIDTLESLKEQDENHYRVYALGEWGIPKDLIYKIPDYIDALPESADEIVWGLDFGFNNPSALIKIAIKDGMLYIQEVLYASGLTNAALINRLEAAISPSERHQNIYADAAEPDRIEEIGAAGFNIHPANKAVTNGIDMVKRFRLFITRDSAHLIKEISGYKWKTDKDGTVLDTPVKFNDHAVDALRYAVHTHFKEKNSRPGLTVFGPNINGGIS